MIFPSYTFLFVFLPIILAGYLLCPQKLRNLWLLAGSLFFYAWGAPKFVFLLLGSSLVDYIISLLLGRATDKQRTVLISASVILNVGLLAYYKYANFFIDQLSALDLFNGKWTTIILPIGISFFTFHKISYVVDVYRNVSKASKNIIDYLLYITFFPQLIAGPIVRYHEIETYLTNRRSDASDWHAGLSRFCIGLGKKVLLADPAGAVANNVFGLSPANLSTPYCWLGAVAYAVQLYFDFSGYSDMAIGLARIFGFVFPENFNQPYLAKNFTDFWRRWHMSLSRWMRDYLYIPLGGNKHGTFATYRNLWIVFLISGLWHGANWTFIIWGAYHGLFLVLDRLGLEKITLKLPVLISRTATFLFVLMGWVLFRSATLADAGKYVSVMWTPTTNWQAKQNVPYGMLVSPHGTTMLLIGLIIIFIVPSLRARRIALPQTVVNSFSDVGTIMLLILSCMSLASGHFSPFIYFQF